MKSFFSMESQALEVLKMPATTPRDQLLSEIKDRSLYYWHADKDLVTELDQLELPVAFHQRNQQLIRYCDLRISSFLLIYKSVDEQTNVYDDQINAYTQQIDSLVTSLK